MTEFDISQFIHPSLQSKILQFFSSDICVGLAIANYEDGTASQGQAKDMTLQAISFCNFITILFCVILFSKKLNS